MGPMMMPNHDGMETAAHHAASGTMAEDPPAPQGHGESGDAECLLMLACGVTAVRPPQFVSVRRSPTISVEPVRLADLPLAGALEGVDPPPPRHDV